jgi:hypothetical protein
MTARSPTVSRSAPSTFEHCPQSIAVCVTAASHRRVRVRGKALSFLLMSEEPTQAVNHLFHIPEVHHRLTIVAKDRAMFRGILGKHACPDGRDLETPHHIPVPV